MRSRHLLVLLAASLSAIAARPPSSAHGLEKATFAGGCFWSLQRDMEPIPGVVSVVSGYTGGTTVNPTYEEVSAGDTKFMGLTGRYRYFYTFRSMDDSPVARAVEALSDAFKALSDPTRVKILSLLKAKGRSCCDRISRTEPGLCACDIESAVKLSQAAVSHHMGLLRRAGLVEAEKRGRWIYYRRNETAIARLADVIARAV